MPVPTAMVGDTIEPIVHEVDERWTMAYAAALDDPLDAYLDPTRNGGVVAHPLFSVCPEWPVIVRSRELSERWDIAPHEVIRSVHASHDVSIHRLIRPGDRLTTSLQIVGVENKRPGALSTTRLVTVDAAGTPVATTTQGGIYLGVEAIGEPCPDSDPPTPVAHADRVGEPDRVAVPVAAGAAHTYTECARIWNPIHTDRAVALGAGLPDIILHGTATLALGVSAVVGRRADGDPTRIRRIGGRFAAMVLMPSTVTVNIWPAVDSDEGGRIVPFEVLNGEGAPAVSDGFAMLD